MTLPALISALEAADGPSRDLDRRVAVASGDWVTDYAEDLSFHGSGTGRNWKNVRLDYSWTQENAENPPPYTASLDAALMLVPEGWAWMTGCFPDEGFFAAMGDGEYGEAKAEALTAPLALCIASLRARAAAGDKP